ncbi:MAG TPA: cytochrome c [Tepidisphaeraceae bacterium]|nr:cytochrome c [Tepidisphaeraceae bacterium]
MTHDPNIPTNLPPVTYEVRPPRLRRPPFWLVSFGLVFIIASWLPLVLFARARVRPNDNTHLALIQDMGTQPKFREQQTNELFADDRADRLPIVGTVPFSADPNHYDHRNPSAYDPAQTDDHYWRGYSSKNGPDGKPVVTWFDSYPEQLLDNGKLTEAFLKRGQERFNIYCSACHGLDGRASGTVNYTAVELKEGTWTPAASLPSAQVRARQIGHIYNTINVGIRTMPGYGAQVPVEDRWAIVAYVKALQLAQNATRRMVPPSERHGK